MTKAVYNAERKPREVFFWSGDQYKVEVKEDPMDCTGCAFHYNGQCTMAKVGDWRHFGPCMALQRSDKVAIRFVETGYRIVS